MVQLHLQLMLFSGEGVRQVLDVLRLAFLYLRMERLQNFTDQRADLLGDAARLLDFINLQQTFCYHVRKRPNIDVRSDRPTPPRPAPPITGETNFNTS